MTQQSQATPTQPDAPLSLARWLLIGAVASGALIAGMRGVFWTVALIKTKTAAGDAWDVVDEPLVAAGDLVTYLVALPIGLGLTAAVMAAHQHHQDESEASMRIMWLAAMWPLVFFVVGYLSLIPGWVMGQ